MKTSQRKKIAIELFTLRKPYVGIGEVCFQLAEKFAEAAPSLKESHNIEFTFIVPKGFEGRFGNDVNYVTATFSNKMLLPFYAGRYDLYHLPHQYCFIKRLPFAKKTLLTIHDINFMYEKSGIKLTKYIHKMRRKIAAADSLVFITHFVAGDVDRVFGHDYKYDVIYNGVTDLTETAAKTDEKLDKKGYLFHISSLQPKKNPALLIEMMQYLPDEHLIMAGDWGSSYAHELRALIKSLGLTNITAMDSVSADMKALLYKNCKAFLFPSLCEGFGLPPLEAMEFGKPAFLSTLTSLPEVGGELAYYWNDLTPKAMADVLCESLNNDCGEELENARRAWAQQFNWHDCADKYIAKYIEMLDDCSESI